MNRNNFGDYVDEICHKCCHNKNNYNELDQAGFLPNIANNIVEFLYCENKCHKCECREYHKETILHWITAQEHFRISEKQYDRFENILFEYCYGKNENAIEDSKDYITRYKMSLEHTEKYLNKFIKLIYEYNKDNEYTKLNYYPEIKLI